MLAGSGPESWLWWDWVDRERDDILQSTANHVELTVLAVGIGFALSFPLALAVRRWRRLAGPVIAVTGILYTIPSLALFALLVPWFGLSRTTALIGLVSYTLLILVRNILAGLDGVPADVREAARGMGFRGGAMLLRVELPLATPAVIAGLRIATVTTIGLVTVTALIAQDSLGQLINDGRLRDFHSPLVVGLVGSVLLAVAADLAFVLLERALTPWARRRRGG